MKPLRRVLAIMALCVLAACTARAYAQTFDLDYDRQPVVALRGLWRFHPGDNPAWAAPTFDDSAWPLLRSDTDWSEQGYPGLSGLAWYRFRVVVPADSPRISLYIPHLMTSYEVFADGVRLGGFGGMPPHEEADHALPETFTLPASKVAHTVTFALRVWHAPLWASYYGGGPNAPALIGVSPLIDQYADAAVQSQAWSVVDEIILSILEGLAGFAALGLFYLSLRDREYLWFGLMLLFSAAGRCFAVWAQSHLLSVIVRDNIEAVLQSLGGLAAVAFYMRLLHGRRNWVFWVVVASVVAGALTEFFDGSLLTVRRSQEISAILTLPFTVWVLTLLIRSARRGLADARLLLFPVLLQQAAALVGICIWLTYLAGWQHSYPAQDFTISTWPFLFTLTDLAAVLFLLAMIAILLGRFTRTRREEERLETEFDAARSVQHLLIPEELPALHGFALDSVYKPASEVGGDFFQIVPLAELGCKADHPAGGAIIVVGDVSGKGLQAAMLVSLIVGSLRTLADQTACPGAILSGLNRRLHERSSGGFTTCLVMRLEASGALIAATAGHLSPYRNGEELPLESGLPLGIVPEAVYAESHFQLEPGDRLTMISDGVLEARNASGELFGFERTRALSTQDAHYIASAAQEFGQEDDITVLTLNRLSEAPA